MKHIRKINELFNKPKNGDAVANRILDIIKDENIKIMHTGGYRVYIDDKIYSFSSYGGIFSPDCYLNIFNKSQEVKTGQYKGAILQDPISKYEISTKIFKKLEKMYKDQQTNISDLQELSDENRASNKYNL